jgi:hypothetical protein
MPITFTSGYLLFILHAKFVPQCVPANGNQFSPIGLDFHGGGTLDVVSSRHKTPTNILTTGFLSVSARFSPHPPNKQIVHPHQPKAVLPQCAM